MITKEMTTDRLHFGYISPIEFLDQTIPPNASFHLCLAHLLKDKAYCDFYRKKRQRGDLIIMDNSAFEFNGSIEPEELIDLVEVSEIEPQIIVAPDYPNQPMQVTLNAFESFQTLITDKYDNKYQLMGVPQSEKGDWMGWLESYQELAGVTTTIGMSILGIPNAVCHITQTNDVSFNRLWATMWLIRNGIADVDVWHHYLGASSPNEVRLQAQLGVASSLDTSSPIWHGLMGIEYDNSAGGLVKGKSKVSVDFDASVLDNKIGLKESNLLKRQAIINRNIQHIEDCCVK